MDITIRSDQIKQLWASSKDAGVRKEEVYNRLSDIYGYTSIKQLTTCEATTFIKGFQHIKQSDYKKGAKMRRKALALFGSLKSYTFQKGARAGQELWFVLNGKFQYANIDIMSERVGGQKLNQYSYYDLVEFIKKVEGFVANVSAYRKKRGL